MKFRTLAAALAVVSLAASPAIAESAFSRATTSVEGESELGGSGTLIALLAAAAIIAGIYFAVDGGSDNPVSP
ncbi:MAG: hypothetical protein A3J40_03205 [Erythrobacter sp. RIFCSPHIGHO2_12_FULL_63_10]|nr:MAG: hypothetical protein A3J40_03205 [Erythrobacter sp. RIFCSPHIGHO2_12_FULL_63_10]